LLGETPLGSEQSLEKIPDSDWKRLRVEVPDDQETLWWLFGLGENVLLHEPEHWVKAVRARADAMLKLYSQSRTNFSHTL